MNSKRYYIDARHENHGNNWDSDYVGNETMTEAEAEKYMAELEARSEYDDPDGETPGEDGNNWYGWEFRLCELEDDDE